METYNPNFILESKDRRGNIRYTGYGIESINDFVYNILYLKNGGDIENLKKNAISAFGEDGLEVTKIAVAIHRSIEKKEIVYI